MSSPSPSHLAHPSPSPSIFNFAPSTSAGNSTSTPAGPPQRSNGAPADDDWDFTSALPDDHAKLPSSNDLTVSGTSVTIGFHLSRPSGSDSTISILAQFSNRTDQLITEYTFHVAVKVTPLGSIRG